MDNADLYHQLLKPQPAIIGQYKPESKLEILAQNPQGIDNPCTDFHDNNLLEKINEKIKNARTVPIFVHDVKFGLVQYIVKANPKDNSIIAAFVYYLNKNNRMQLYSTTYFESKNGNDLVIYYKPDSNNDWKDIKNTTISCIDNKGYIRAIVKNLLKKQDI